LLLTSPAHNLLSHSAICLFRSQMYYNYIMQTHSGWQWGDSIWHE